MRKNKGQAVVELAVLMLVIVLILNISLQITKYLEALQKTQSAAYYAAQCWSIERPRQITGDDLWAATEDLRESIENRVEGFLEGKDFDEGAFSVNFGVGDNDSRVEVNNTVKIDFPWHKGGLIKTVKAKADGDFHPLFTQEE